MSMRLPLPRCVRSLALLAFVAPSIGAQEFQERELPKPNATLKDQLRFPSSAYPTGDGNLLVIDNGLRKVVRVDFAAGTVSDVMSQGPDAGNYRTAAAFWPWPGDSVGLYDIRMNVVHVLPLDGSASSRNAQVIDSSIFIQLEQPAGGGGRGGAQPTGPRFLSPITPQFLVNGTHAYGLGLPTNMQRTPPGAAPQRASLAILKLSLATGAIDSIARFTAPQANKSQRMQGTAMVITYDATPFMPGDAWFTYRDGTVGIVRGTTYRMDLYGTDGERTRIEPIPYPKIDITDKEKEEFKKNYERAERSRIANMPRRPSGAITFEDSWTWPKQHPPFMAKSGVRVGPDDRIWLRVRCVSSEKHNCYDVIDRTGKRVARWKLNQNEFVVAIGKGVVYTVNREKEDNPVLQRHAVE